MRSRSPRQPNSRLKKVSRICSCPRAPFGYPLSHFHGIPARGVTSTGGASSNVPTGCDGSPVKWSASPQRAPTPSSTLRTDHPGSCRLRRTSCCKAVKGANNLNREPSAAQKMLSVKARVGALYSGSFHALSCREELVAEIHRKVLYAVHTSSAPPYSHCRKVKGGAAPSDERSRLRLNIHPCALKGVRACTLNTPW